MARIYLLHLNEVVDGVRPTGWVNSVSGGPAFLNKGNIGATGAQSTITSAEPFGGGIYAQSGAGTPCAITSSTQVTFAADFTLQGFVAAPLDNGRFLAQFSTDGTDGGDVRVQLIAIDEGGGSWSFLCFAQRTVADGGFFAFQTAPIAPSTVAGVSGYHWALQRESTFLTMRVNGSLRATATTALTGSLTGYIDAFGSYEQASGSCNGLYQARASELAGDDAAVYSGSTYTVPTARFADPGGGGDVTLALTGNAGTAAVGTVSLAVDKALTGNSGTGAVGTVVQSRTKALTNNVGTGAPGAVVQSRSLDASGVDAAGLVGDVAVDGTADVTVALTGVEADGAVGDAGDSTDVALSGVEAAGAVGDVTPSVAGNVTVALSGVSGLGEVGNVSVQGDAPGRPIVEFVQGSGRTIRQVTHQPLLQRILAQRRAERYKPSRERAAKRAKVIEVQAAQTVLDGGGEASFRALMNEWLEQRPVLPVAEPPSQAFMAQVAFRIQQMQAEQQALAALAARQNDEEAVIALLLA